VRNTFVIVGQDEPETPVQHTSDEATAIPDELGFSGTQTAKVVGISYRQLDYWARTDLILPSLTDAAGSGSRRLYSYNDLLELKAIKKLLDAGIKLEQVRKVFEFLREQMNTDIAAAHIVIDGGSVMLCDGDQLIDVLKNGQGVLNVLSLSGVRDELEADLAPAATPPVVIDTRRRTG
jgi:DNA-binding transcriptional MerR regulator